MRRPKLVLINWEQRGASHCVPSHKGKIPLSHPLFSEVSELAATSTATGMEAQKQKTQRERDGADGPKKKVRVVEEARDDVEVEAPPSEAEVEEFFAIVRRMHMAVKYFGQRAGKLPGKWRAALEADEVVAAEAAEVLDDKERAKKKAAATPTPKPEGVEEESGVFDLNSAPAEECTG